MSDCARDILGVLPLRILTLRVWSGVQAGLPQGTPEESLTLIGLTFLQDPVRPDVREALYACRGAGVNVIMVTGTYH